MKPQPRELVPFIGGPYDGQALPVPHPILPEMELRVLPRAPSAFSAFYALGEDGCFHYLPLAGETEGEANFYMDSRELCYAVC